MLFIDDGLSLLLYRLLNKQYQLNSCSHYEYSAKMSSTNKLKGWLQDILRWFIKTVTFFTVFPFVAWITDTGSHNTGPMATAGDVNALVGGNVTLWALPAAVTHAATFKVLTIPTA